MNGSIAIVVAQLHDANYAFSPAERDRLATLLTVIDFELERRTDALRRIRHLLNLDADTDLVLGLPICIERMLIGEQP
ncbi:hypothetical protein B0G84_3297 [Paraburkholderia sp. BL8N3]|nr:hypothetical protein [Paraburkholderia sp. BL8N3]TCK37995.1 hypothetical protein B0G84_3297 [Paraburkholderia sp. BL8N3]